MPAPVPAALHGSFDTSVFPLRGSIQDGVSLRTLTEGMIVLPPATGQTRTRSLDNKSP